MAWIVAYFESSGSPSLHLLPLIRIRYVENGLIIVEDYMEEVGNGFYRFEFTTYDITKDYTILVDGGSLLASSDRFLEGATGEYGSMSNNISILVDNIDCRVTLMKKMATNRLEMVDGNSNNWILYDDDNITQLFSFDASDVTGGIIVQTCGMASKRLKAEEN